MTTAASEPLEHAPRCPACGAEVLVSDDALLGEVLWCAQCGAELELIALTPRRLALYEEEEK